MSSEPAAVMDFLGVENEERKSSLQRQVDRSALHSSLSKIKPQMMQQVLSWRGLLDKPKTESESGKADVNKALGLFPQTTGFGPAVENFGHSQSPAHHHSRILPYFGHSASQGTLPACPTRKSSPQLTIFYNGTVNVFDVDEGKAQAIMTLAESLNSNPQNKNPTTDASTATIPKKTSAEESYASTAVASPTADPRNSTSPQMRADLPIARKHSLQRFLQKRKDRLISKAPYETTLPSKVTREEEIASPERAGRLPVE